MDWLCILLGMLGSTPSLNGLLAGCFTLCFHILLDIYLLGSSSLVALACWVLCLFWLGACALRHGIRLGILGSSSPLVSCPRALPLPPVGLVGFFLSSGWLFLQFGLTSCWACWVCPPFWLGALSFCPDILLGLLASFSLPAGGLWALPPYPVGPRGFSLLAGCPHALHLNFQGPLKSFFSSG